MRVGKVIMLQLHQEFNGIRKTILKDVDYLAPILRTEDKREILDGAGQTPYQALLKGLKVNISFGKSVKTETIAKSIAIPVKTPK